MLCDYGCGKEANFIFKNGKQCCSKIKDKCEGFKLMMRQKNLARFGVVSTAQLESTKQKQKKTNLEKYGCEWTQQNIDIKNKRKETNIERYGFDVASKNDGVKEKTKATCLQIYGVETHLLNQEIQEKIKKTNLERYGSENVFASEKIKDKIKKTNLEKYGQETSMHIARKSYFELTGFMNPSNDEKILLLKKQNYMKKYGVEHQNQIHIKPDSFKKMNDQVWLENESKIKSLSQIADELEVHPSTLYRIFKINNIHITNHVISYGHQQIIDYIKSIVDTEIKINDRFEISPQELDIFLPEYNLAIEYCGLYWHSDVNIADKNYHANKLKSCNEKGIRLLTIFEDEWLNNQDTCKSVIKHILKQNTNIIYARKCEIIQISNKEYYAFIKQHHLQQNSSNTSITYGLKYNNEIVAIMSFNKIKEAYKRHIGYNDIFDLVRFATNGASVIGGASKLLNYFIKNNIVDLIITYADLRWSDGNLYKTLGFEDDGVVPPDYSYVKGNRRLHKYNFRKSKLKDVDVSETETEITKKMGLGRIYDCGKLRFKLIVVK